MLPPYERGMAQVRDSAQFSIPISAVSAATSLGISAFSAAVTQLLLILAVGTIDGGGTS